MGARWFRSPVGVLHAAKHPAQVDRYTGRGWEEVEADAAVAEIAGGTQAAANAERAAADAAAREQRLADEQARKVAARQQAAQRVVADAQAAQQAQQQTPADE